LAATGNQYALLTPTRRATLDYLLLASTDRTAGMLLENL
jgi:hypothetical protein